MKKSLAAIFSLLILSAVFSFTGCLADAVADDGSGYPASGSGSGGTGGAGGGTGTGWALCKDSSYDIFELQVWGDGAGTFDYKNESGYGRFTVTEKGGGWVGGGLICADTTKTFDFTGVKKMKFDVRGNVSPKALCIAVQNNQGASAKMYPSKTSLTNSSAKINSLSETDWTSVEFDVSGAASDVIINAFCIIVAGDWGGSFDKTQFFEIRNLDWVDSDGKSVKLSLK